MNIVTADLANLFLFFDNQMLALPSLNIARTPEAFYNTGEFKENGWVITANKVGN